jgi:hypothetical protein
VVSFKRSLPPGNREELVIHAELLEVLVPGVQSPLTRHMAHDLTQRVLEEDIFNTSALGIGLLTMTAKHYMHYTLL